MGLALLRCALSRGWVGAVLLLGMACRAQAPPSGPEAEEILRHASRDPASVALSDLGAGDEAFSAAVARAAFPSPRTMSLNGNRLGAPSMRALGEEGRCERLRWLNLTDNPLGDEGALALANSGCLSGLERLFLSGAGLGPSGAEAIASSGSKGLHYLAIGRQPLGSAGASALARMTQLRHLEIPEAGVGTDGCAALLTHPHLEVLVLDGNPVAGGLARVEALGAQLQHLSLQAAGLQPEDLLALGELQPPTSLRRLTLSGNPLPAEGLEALARVPWLSELEKLEVEGSGAPLEARQAVVDAWGRRAGLSIERR